MQLNILTIFIQIRDQDEVKLISQMNLQEYLEDRIGTSKYKVPIEEANKMVEALDKERSERLNRFEMMKKTSIKDMVSYSRRRECLTSRDASSKGIIIIDVFSDYFVTINDIFILETRNLIYETQNL